MRGIQVKQRRRGTIGALILFSALMGGRAHADEVADADERVAARVSHNTATAILLGEGSLYLFGGKEGKETAVVSARALLETGLATTLLKHTIREKRPTGNSRTSFPSGHTSAAFAFATVLAERHPKYQWAAYGAATLVGWSRVEVRAHRWRDVLAGAALGHWIGRRAVKRQHLFFGPEGVGLRWTW